MKKHTIVFSSSSDESDSEEIKVIPQANKPAQKITLTSDYSYGYEDSTSSDKPVNVKQPIHPVRQARPQPGRSRPQAKKPLPQRPNVTPKLSVATKMEPKQIIKEEDDDYYEEDVSDQIVEVQVKSTPQTKKPHPPPPQQPQKVQQPQQSQQPHEIEKRTNQTFEPRPPHSQQQNDMDQFEIRNSNSGEEDPSDNDVFEINSQNPDNSPNEESIIPQALATPTRHFPITDNMKTFTVQRTKKHSIRGKSFIYSFLRNSQPLLYSKCVSRHPKGTMPITSNSDVHIKGTSDYSITIDNNCRSFVIKSATQTVMTYTIDIPTKIPKLPRLLIEIDQEFAFKPKVMTSKRPVMSKKGCWVLDFHNKFTLPSEKNAIFIENSSKTRDEDLIVVRKVAKDRIEIDCNLEPTDVVIFGIGLAAFIGKLK